MNVVKRYTVERTQMLQHLESHSLGTVERVVVFASDFDRVTAERDALQLRLNAADQRIDELTQRQGEQVNSYPPCDYCGVVPDYHPWHGSGVIDGKESPHIHACSECRHKLPGHTSKSL